MVQKMSTGLIPELRFPEFLADGEWQVKKLENHIDLFSGIALKSEEISDDKSGIPILRGINITEGYIRHSNEIDKYFLGDVEILSKYLVKENDIVIGMDGSKVGKNVALIRKEDENSILIQRVARIRTNEKADLNYIYQNFISDRFRGYVDKVNTSSGIPHISAQQIKDFIVGFPPNLREQQKIAACLSSLDEMISANSQKLDALKNHKKGLMQNLFPQEGETVPKCRFTEFENDGEWVEKKLGEWVDFVMGNAFKSEDFVEDGLQLIRMGNLYQGELQLNRTPVFLPRSFEAEYSRFLIRPQDLLMSMTGTMGKKDYGFVVEIPKNSNTLLLNQRVLKIIPKKNCLKGFVLQQLKHDTFLDKLFSIPGGTKQANLSTKDLKEIKVIFPSLREQEKIAYCLSSLDELITAQAEKIDQLKLHKKGLMQGLFPNSITD